MPKAEGQWLMIDGRGLRAKGLWPRGQGPRAKGPGAKGLSRVMMEYFHACMWHVFICSIQEIRVFVDGRFCRRLLAIFNKLCCEILDWILDI